MMTARLLAALFLFGLARFSAALPPDDGWRKTSEHTRKTLVRMDELINSEDRETAYARYMAMFHPRVSAWGLHEQGAADIDAIRDHYRAVFFELGGGVLVTDKLVVAGPMAAQRYHSMMVLNGTFDGVEAREKTVVIRGQTFFLIDEEGLIQQRWSNHDHAYRMEQLLGAQGREEGQRLSSRLNGPGPDVSESGLVLEGILAAFNQPEAPAARENDTASFFSDDFKFYGIGPDGDNAKAFLDLLAEVWRSYPDLILSTGDPIVGWGYVATDWRATGSHREGFRGIPANNAPVCFHGEVIARLTSQGKLEAAWIDVYGQCPP
jgi:predicted ester cyclase